MQSAHTSQAGAGHGSAKSYVIGFVLSIILTVIPFWIVMHPSLSHSTVMAVIYGFAVVQILIHLVCFLHMNTSSEQRWNVVAFAFTVLVVAILISGSVWIMLNVKYNMMQPTTQMMNE
jgi:cytochrome o ubiquinol oxidase operon protein cyoD